MTAQAQGSALTGVVRFLSSVVQPVDTDNQAATQPDEQQVTAVSPSVRPVLVPRGLSKAAGIASLVFLLGAVIYGTAAHFTGPAYPYDDAFIIYRYVDNFLTGQGLVYNAGERVFGVSTPFYIAWVTTLKAVAPSAATPDLAVRGNFVFYLVTVAGLALLMRRLLRVRWLALAAAGAFALRPTILAASTGGMESLALAGFAVWVLWAIVGRRTVLAGVLAGLSVLVRPEGALLILAVLVAWFAAGRKRLVPVLAGLLVPGLVLVAALWLYYGTPVYQSLVAKAAPLYPLRFGSAVVALWRQVLAWSEGSIPRVPAVAGLAALALVVLGYGFKFRRAVLRRQDLAPVAGLFVLLALFYLATNPLMFEWYYPVIETVWFALFFTGLVWLAARARRWRRWAGLPVGLILAFVTLFPAARLVVANAASNRPVTDLRFDEDPPRLRIDTYRAVAQRLNLVLPEGATLAGPEIGSLGYYYRRGRITDACGLVSPEAVRFLPVPAKDRFSSDCGAIGLDLVKALTPDVVVTLGTFAGRSLYDNDWFWANYVRVWTVRLMKETWGTRTADVFFYRYAGRLDRP